MTIKLYPLLLSLLALAACNSAKPTPPAPPPGSSLKLLEVTIDLRNNTASARALQPGAVKGQAATTYPASNQAIELTQQATGLDDDDVNHVRYVYATFLIENNTGDNMQNLTLWALDAPTLSGSLSAPTKFGTMFSSVKDGAGNEIGDGALVRSIQPVHGVRNVLGEFKIDKKLADLQLINGPEQTQVEGQLNATYGLTGASALGFGYVARDFSGTGRQIAASNGLAGRANSCTADSCKGFVTIAYKLSFDPALPREQRPFVFTSVFALGDQDSRFTSQSLEDQARPSIAGKPVTDFRGTPRLLAGSSIDFYLDSPQNLCQVTTAFTSGSFSDKVKMPGTLSTTPGKRDTCFGSGGVLGLSYPSSTGVGSDFIVAKAAVLDSQDRMVLAGTHSGDFAVWRFTGDKLDKSFSGDGQRLIDFGAVDAGVALDLDSSGKIVVAGTVNGGLDIGVVRLNEDGTLDTSFAPGGADGDGKLTIDNGGTETASGVAVEGDFIFVSGTSGASPNRNFLVAKVKGLNGSLDTSFGAALTGITTINFAGGNDDYSTGIDAASTSEIYVAGVSVNAGANDWAIAKLNFNGILDSGFNGTGAIRFDPNSVNGGISLNFDEANAIQVDSSGNIVVAGSNAGSTTSNFVVARLSSLGAFDSSFDGDGVSISGLGGFDVATSLAFTSDGSIVLGGYSNDSSGVEHFVGRKFSSLGAPSTIYEKTNIQPTSSGQDKANATLVNSSSKVILVGQLAGTIVNNIGIVQYNQ